MGFFQEVWEGLKLRVLLWRLSRRLRRAKASGDKEKADKAADEMVRILLKRPREATMKPNGEPGGRPEG